MKAIKLILFLIVGLPLLALAIAVVFILTIDPNRFKPQINAALADRGIQSEFKGDISWTFLPNLGLHISGLDLKNDQGLALLEVGELGASVELKPLFNKRVIVDAISIDDTTLHYTLNEEGVSNWEDVFTESSASDSDVKSDEKPLANESGSESVVAFDSLNLNVVEINNLNISYHDIKEENRTELQGLSLKSRNVNLEGQSFPIEVGASIAFEGATKTAVSVSAKVSLDSNKTLLGISEGDLSFTLGETSFDSTMGAEFNWASLNGFGRFSLSKVMIPSLFTALGIDLPKTTNPHVLQTFSLSTEFTLSENAFYFHKIDASVDDTSINGGLHVSQFSPLKVASHWQIDFINVDDYMAPVEAVGIEDKTKDVEPVDLPLQMLREFSSADLSLTIDQAMFTDTRFDDIRAGTEISNGIVLSTISALVSEGKISGKSELNAEDNLALLEFDLEAKGIHLGPILENVAELKNIQGTSDAIISGSSKGRTDLDLINNLAFKGAIKSPEMMMTPFNVEQQFCQAMALALGKQAPDYQWPEQTTMSPMESLIEYENQTVTVESLNASVSKLNAKASGKFNVDTGQFEFPVQLNLGSFAGELAGCLPIPDSWRKVDVPLLCKGNVSGIDYKTCLPNAKLIGRLAEKRLKAEANKKLDAEKDRVEEKLKDKAKDKLQKELGEEKAKELEEKLRGFLKGL